MKKLLSLSVLVAGVGLLPGLAAAQEVGKVISSTPVLKKVTEPKSTCTNDADGKQRCTTQMVSEDRTVGYKVVYEYAGKRHTVQLPSAPGATIPLEVRVAVQGVNTAPVETVYSAQPPVVETVRERVYVESPYYYGPYYSSYYNPWYPVVGLGLGYAAGYYIGGWRGHRHAFRGHRGHWRR